MVAATSTSNGDDERIAALRRIARAERPTRSEQHWINRIEVVRGALAASNYPIRVGATSVSVGDFTTRASKNVAWGLWLMRLARALRPVCCLELGTGVGISGAYIAAGLELAARGTLTTIDGNPECVRIASRVFGHLGLSRRVRVVEAKFAEATQPVLERSRPVGLAFIDGHHLERPTVRYVTRFARARTGVIVVDDLHWSASMRKAWSRLASAPEFCLAVDLAGVGVLVPNASRDSTR